MSQPNRLAREGAVLPMALAIMVIIGLAASTALFTGRQERQSSWNTRLQTTALGAADRAAAELLDQLATVAPSLAIGASVDRHLLISAGVDANVRLTRVGATLFVLTAEGQARAGQHRSARRRTSLILRLDPPALGVPAALSVIGALAPDPALVNGVDTAPDGWPCDESRSDSVAIAHPSPAPDSSLLRALRDRASLRLPAGTIVRGAHPSVRDGVCDTARPDNLGDPDRAGPCGSWLPVVHASGDLMLDGGTGQGILLVDGGLTLGGGFRFVGVVIVDGTLELTVGGASIAGAVIAGGVTAGAGSESATPVVHRSTCAIESALVAAGSLVPVPDRPWVIGR